MNAHRLSTYKQVIQLAITVQLSLSASYCVVCPSVREDNPLALASGLSPVHTQNHTITTLFHQHACLYHPAASVNYGILSHPVNLANFLLIIDVVLSKTLTHITPNNTRASKY